MLDLVFKKHFTIGKTKTAEYPLTVLTRKKLTVRKAGKYV